MKVGCKDFRAHLPMHNMKDVGESRCLFRPLPLLEWSEIFLNTAKNKNNCILFQKVVITQNHSFWNCIFFRSNTFFFKNGCHLALSEGRCIKLRKNYKTGKNWIGFNNWLLYRLRYKSELYYCFSNILIESAQFKILRCFNVQIPFSDEYTYLGTIIFFIACYQKSAKRKNNLLVKL